MLCYSLTLILVCPHSAPRPAAPHVSGKKVKAGKDVSALINKWSSVAQKVAAEEEAAAKKEAEVGEGGAGGGCHWCVMAHRVCVCGGGRGQDSA